MNTTLSTTVVTNEWPYDCEWYTGKVVFVNFNGLSYHLTGGTDKKYYTVTNAYLQILIKTHTLKKKQWRAYY
jgi:hypothetical protein